MQREIPSALGLDLIILINGTIHLEDDPYCQSSETEFAILKLETVKALKGRGED